MKIGIANDHHGIDLKNKIISYLKNKGIEVVNCGCDTADNVDYVDYVVKLCSTVNNKEVDLGILICGTGIGVSIAANKIKGILCGLVRTPEEAKLAREHNMINVMALSEYTTDFEKIIDNFLNTQNSTEERHIRRINKIKELEK